MIYVYLLLTSCLEMALASEPDDQSKVMYLEELLLNVSNTYHGLGKKLEDIKNGIKANTDELGQLATKVRSVVEESGNINRNIQLISKSNDHINDKVQHIPSKNETNQINANVNTVNQQVGLISKGNEEINEKLSELLADGVGRFKSDIEEAILENIKENSYNLRKNTDVNEKQSKLLEKGTAFLHEGAAFFGKSAALLERGNSALERILFNMEKKGSEKVLEVRDCVDVHKNGNLRNGIYNVSGYKTYCDMESDGGGWMVFQRRGDFGFPQDYFFRTWNEYKYGFGEMDKEFWMGNDRLSAITMGRPHQLRVDLWDMEGNQRHAKYFSFSVQNEQALYRLHTGGYSGNAGDSLSHHSNVPFTTKDKDNAMGKDCALKYKGAWWYVNCHISNLNGLNLRGSSNLDGQGIVWYHWRGGDYSLAFTEMKIRPVAF